MKGLVSVLVPTFNGEAFVRATIESVLAQDHPAVEVVVCDDGSSDGTRGVLRSFGDAIRLIEQPNQGVSAARNRCLAGARGEFVAFLDQDDCYEPRMLSTQIEQLERRTECGFVYADSWIVDGQGRPRGRRGDYLPYAQGPIFERLLTGNFIPLETLVLRTELLRTVGGFRQDLRYLEDFELCLRLARRSPAGFTPWPLARYRIHGRNLSYQGRALVLEYLRVLDELAADPSLSPGEARVVRAQQNRRRAELAWYALRRGDVVEAEGWLAQLDTSVRRSLRLKIAAARTLYALLPRSWIARLLDSIPRTIYGVRRDSPAGDDETAAPLPPPDDQEPEERGPTTGRATD